MPSTPPSPAVEPSYPYVANLAPEDWEHLVRTYSPELRRFLEGRVRRLPSPVDSDAAEEVLQETWCRAFERGGPLFAGALAHGEEATRAYLFLIATRILLDKVRRGCAVKRGRNLSPFECSAALGLGARARDPYWNPELRFLLSEGRRDFARQCVRLARRTHRSDLRRRNLRILRRALLEGWSSCEIVRAERRYGLRLTASTIDTMISRARSRFAHAGWRLPERGRRRPVG